jgi:Zn-dependent protease with chaperone function
MSFGMAGVEHVALLRVVSWALSFAILPFSTGLVLTWLAARVALAGWVADEHWSMRARRIAPAAYTVMIASWVAATVAGMAVTTPAAMLFPRPPAAGTFAAGFVAWLGGVTAGWLVLGPLRPPESLARHLRDALRMMIVIPYFPIIFGMCAALVAPPIARGLVLAAGTAAWVAFSVWGFLPIARLLRLATPAPEKLARAVERAAARAGRMPRSVEVVDVPMANAFANLMTQQLVFTRSTVDALSEEELAAVAAHEIAHLGEPRSVVWVRLAANLTLLPVVFMPTLIGGLGLLGAVGVSYLGLITLVLPLRILQRRMETRADHGAACGEGDPRALGTALEKIAILNLSPAVGARQGTHPDLYDRMLAAGVEPDFPRPERPSRTRLVAGILTATVIAFVAYLVRTFPDVPLAVLPDPMARAYVEIALTGGSRSSLFHLATAHGEARPAEALATAEFLAAEMPGSPSEMALRAWALGLNGKCEDALVQIAEAEELADELAEEHDVRGDYTWIYWAQRHLGHCTEDVEE